ncbi:MAG: O-antigen ligase family protein, partial [Solirubrobacteraceae bacterium]
MPLEQVDPAEIAEPTGLNLTNVHQFFSCAIRALHDALEDHAAPQLARAPGAPGRTITLILLRMAARRGISIPSGARHDLTDVPPGDGPATPSVSGSVAGTPGRFARGERLRFGGLAAIGVAAGISALFSAYYNADVWVPLGLGLVVVAAAATLARPPRLTLPVILVLLGLSGLGLLSLISGSWSQGVEQAIVAGNRWLVYAALFLLTVVLVHDQRSATALLVAVGIGIAVVAVSLLARMLGSDPGAVFLYGRLNLPLGYVNGEGCVFAMACWLSLALAERRRPVLAGAGAGATVAFGCMALLSQSRGALIATGVSVVVALLLVPGARRRLLALAAIAAGIALASGPVLRVYSVGQTGLLPSSVAHSAAGAILGASAATGVLWGLIVAIGEVVARRGGTMRVAARRTATVAAVAVVALPSAAALIRISSIERAVSTQWQAFVHLSAPVSASVASTRLFSGAGNRYDYWRVAWNVFLHHPLAGVGAGNYTQYYYLERRTTEAIQNPHSIELQTLS